MWSLIATFLVWQPTLADAPAHALSHGALAHSSRASKLLIEALHWIWA